MGRFSIRASLVDCNLTLCGSLSSETTHTVDLSWPDSITCGGVVRKSLF